MQNQHQQLPQPQQQQKLTSGNSSSTNYSVSHQNPIQSFNNSSETSTSSSNAIPFQVETLSKFKNENSFEEKILFGQQEKVSILKNGGVESNSDESPTSPTLSSSLHFPYSRYELLPFH